MVIIKVEMNIITFFKQRRKTKNCNVSNPRSRVFIRKRYLFFFQFHLSLSLIKLNTILTGGTESQLYFFLLINRKGIYFSLMNPVTPGPSSILSKVFLSENMQLKLTKYCSAFSPRYSNDNTKCYSKQCIGR